MVLLNFILWDNSSDFGVLLLTTVIAISGIFLLMVVFNMTGGRLASKWVKHEFTLLNDFDVEDFLKSKGDNRALTRIKRQYLHTREKAIQHFKIMTHFHVRYYAIINLTAICGIISAILAFVIMDSGWKQSGIIVLTLFFVFSSATTYFTAFPKFFAHKKNIALNKLLSLQYRHLLNKIESYICSDDESKFKTESLDQFLMDIDKEIENIADYPLSMEINTSFNPRQVYHQLNGNSGDTI